MSESHCKGCGARIVWGVTEDGKRIPMDPRLAVYLLVNATTESPYQSTEKVERLRTAMVSHFVTCPKRDQFSKGRKKT